MLRDMQNMFSGTKSAAGVFTGQAITVDAISENVLDLRNGSLPTLANEGAGDGNPWLVIQVLTAAAGGDAAKTVIFTLESDSTADLATSATTHWTSATLTGATLVAGYRVCAVRLPSEATYERYLGVRYNVSATFTAFSVTAFLAKDVPDNVTYRSGFSL